MTTYRERREARVEKLRDWGDKRAASSDAAYQGVRQIADQIPFGQPILVGHHSEGRARRDQDRMHTGMRRAIDDQRMAERHVGRADEIEHQLATSIYSDDEDAVERLTEKLAGLEAKREQRKAANAAYRAAHKAELKAMTPYERSQAVPYPSYSISNLGGQITSARKRLEYLKADKAVVAAGGRGGGRMMTSRYGGTCPDCGETFERGDQIMWFRLTREATHAVCPAKEDD